MQMQPFALFQCWNGERIGEVINKEAASVDTATFLATHVPLNKLTYHRVPQSISDTSENGLLQELRRCAEQDKHAFVVVQGIPGTGKSHLIRWLKERYETEADRQHEQVLFIERAQCSLRSTLEQIIKSPVFDKETMKEQLEKLNGARIELSREALSHTLLSQLQVAIGEMPQVEMPRWLARNSRLEKYLLDFVVRQELMKAGGPIDRIVRFLRNGSGIQNREMPKFEENDFIFDQAIRRRIGGYQDAQYVADKLQGEDGAEERHGLVSYLNQLLPFAIGHATALTSDDFKQIFYDLRRHLRQRNQSLILFIEDITALTGIDTGLLDVLATQHVGEGNQNFCRITSVVGITDNYFMDYFPDNMKDRVTHRLTLNATNSTHSDTEFLVDEEATAALAARYLNVMRLEQQELDEWLRQGGKPAQLPNACTNCAYKTVCHTTFGTHKIQIDSEHEQDIGLYPFNKKAVWTLYQHIDTSSSKRTPRSLLHNVLLYIMQSHGPKVTQGLFPPAPSELGGEFITFSLNKPMQRNVIAAQGGNDARRIETLVMIWGNGTIDAKQGVASSSVGSLTEEVFCAFGIKPIAGESIAVSRPSVISQKSVTRSSPLVASTSKPYSIGENDTTENAPSSFNLSNVGAQNRFVKDITEWSNGGKLVYYADYRDLLVPLIRSFIDWDFYQISNKHLEDSLKGRRIYIERQEGKVTAAHYLTLRYEPELVAVLLALVDTKEKGQALEDAVLSGCLSSFSIWLHMHEAEIVQFVQQPHRSVCDLLPLDEMLLFSCLIMACLQGALQPSYKSIQDLWLDLVRFCVSTRNSTAEWEQLRQKVGQQHSHTWAGLVKQITPKRASELCSWLLSTLNCAQGGSNDVRFLDAPMALRLLKQLQSNDWQLPTTASLDSAAVPPWSEVVATYTTIQNQFAAALNDDCELIQDLLTRLSTFIEDRPPKEVFQAIQTYVKTMAETQRGTSFAIKRSLNATQFTGMQTNLHNILKEKQQEQLALRLSSIGELYLQAQEYIAYFSDFVKEATKLREANVRKLAQLQDQVASESISKLEEVRSMYQEIVSSLAVQLVEEEKI
jgi:Cdc6-like AAA superfamily ATPase